MLLVHSTMQSARFCLLSTPRWPSVRSFAVTRRHASTAHFASQQHRSARAPLPSRPSSSAPVRRVADAPPSSRPALSTDRRMASLQKELHDVKRELCQVRLQLAQQQQQQQQHTVSSQSHSPASCSLCEAATRALQQLATLDEAAQSIATELRYTGMALQCSQDRLEVELRRLLAIGLTEEEVDAAAIEAGARRYVRANIGYRVAHVNEEPAPVVDVAKSRVGVSTTSTRL